MMNRSDQSRRQFLKTTAAAGAAMTVSLDVARSAHAAGSDVLKLALIGCGGRGTGAVVQALNARKDVQLFALADIFPEQVEGAAKRIKEMHGDRVNVDQDRMFVGADAYKDAIACGADVIQLATPPGFRPEHYLAAIDAGKHVFMEKPVCVDAPGYRTVMKANQIADDNGLKVAVGLQRRHSKYYTGNIAKLHDGQLGDIVLLRAYWNGNFGWQGYNGKPPEEGEMEWQVRNWNHFNWISGDHIVEQHVHNIDVCNWIMKDQHPVEANGMGSRLVRKNSEMYDHHFVEFTYADETKMYSQCRQMPNCWPEVNEYARGTKGSMELGGRVGNNGNDGYTQEHADLFDAIRNGTGQNDGWHAANSTMTAVLGRMATHSGAVVKWDDAVKSDEKLGPDKFSLDAEPPVTVGPDGLYAVDIPGVYKAV
jgi:predicted dehydrogenase